MFTETFIGIIAFVAGIVVTAGFATLAVALYIKKNFGG